MENKELLQTIIAKLDEIEYDIKNEFDKAVIDLKEIKQNIINILESDLHKIKRDLQFISEGKDPNQAWFWTEEWQQAEAEVEDDIQNGRVKSFNNVEDLIAELHKNDEEDENNTLRKGIPPLDELLKKITTDNRHAEIDFVNSKLNKNDTK